MPKKIKSYQTVFEKSSLIEKLTTTDESALEKLRCLSAGGAKNTRPSTTTNMVGITLL